MKIILDTNAYVDLCKGNEKATAVTREAEQIFIPFISLAELRAGYLCGSKAAQNERYLARFLSTARVEILFPDEQTTHHYARLFYQLRKQGTPIPTNDIWIASLTMQHNLMLLSGDGHFDNLPQIPRG
ncbi:MAG: type II toxin-antitoxin system VapC family toxin [Deltaproteobacteria bacterium]|nr:type II toxin-antitoxin system VapC family toxin [Deltaproteobacteria bacterium]